MKSARITERVCAISFGAALLFSPESGNTEEITGNSFRCLTKMTPVRQFYVDNLRGDLAATLAAANSAKGATYPPGSVVQLIPGEVMVKHDRGFNAQTHDWEFFVLDTSKDGTRIQERGTTDIANQFGTCLSCHSQAAPQWDLICEMNHGCPPLPVTLDVVHALQKAEPRCDKPTAPDSAATRKQ